MDSVFENSVVQSDPIGRHTLNPGNLIPAIHFHSAPLLMLIPEFLPIPGRFLHIFSKFHFLFFSLTLLLITLKKKNIKNQTTKGKQNKTGLSSTTPESFRTIRKESEQSKTNSCTRTQARTWDFGFLRSLLGIMIPGKLGRWGSDLLP
ncbi:hypothetical protein PanWU01x14_320710 [Parasponia andersonii]|uniref:Transmembrane protein n=1 Tax=Parasponia andersonii TaxID=3476 RepID=A0A2P5ALF9_PARAD|nr:hypothetical protein PanWU01x14_320710 [Parasponia andersonii]